jgi:hypothetical protein
MKLYNQTKNNLRWDLSLTTYTCQPYGEVEVPDMFVLHCKKRGLPLDVTPVAPEVKANKSLEAATEQAKKDEVFALQKQLAEAIASEGVAKSKVSELLSDKSALEQDKTKVLVSLASVESKYKALIDDNQALTKLFEEQTKALEISKEETKIALANLDIVKKANATVTESAKPVVSDPKKNK